MSLCFISSSLTMAFGHLGSSPILHETYLAPTKDINGNICVVNPTECFVFRAYFTFFFCSIWHYWLPIFPHTHTHFLKTEILPFFIFLLKVDFHTNAHSWDIFQTLAYRQTLPHLFTFSYYTLMNSFLILSDQNCHFLLCITQHRLSYSPHNIILTVSVILENVFIV